MPGSTRVGITFPDNTVRNTWLRVTVVANANTGLSANDVFYFGNVIGELDFGNTATRLRVNGQDAALILANQSPGANSANVTNKFDLDRNGRVNGQDYAILLANQQAAGIVAPITAPSARPVAPSVRPSAPSVRPSAPSVPQSTPSRGLAVSESGSGSDSGNVRAVPLPTPAVSLESNRGSKEANMSNGSQNFAISANNGLFETRLRPQQNRIASGMTAIALSGTEVNPTKEKEKKDAPNWKSLDSFFASLWS